MVNKKYYERLNNYFKLILTQKKLINIKDSQIYDINGELLANNQPFNFNLIYKNIFIRDIKLSIGNNQIGPQLIKLKQLYSKSIKSFVVGHKITAFLTNDDILFYTTTSEFSKEKNNLIFQQRKDIKMFTANRNLIYLTKENQIHIIFYRSDIEPEYFAEDMLLFTLNNPIETFYSSFNFLLLITKNMKIYVISLFEIDVIKMNDLNKIKEVIYESEMIKSILFCSVTFNAFYIVNEENTVFICDLNFEQNNQLEKLFLKIYSPLKNKKIFYLTSSLTSCFAIQKEEVESVDKWDNHQVLLWANEIGFFDCLKLLKFYKISGNDLLKIDNKFLKETLGIKSEDKQNYFLKQIDLKIKKTYKKPILLAWGNNSYGQLGLNNLSSFSPPFKVSIPKEIEENDIEKIECGWRTTAILTKNKQLWVTEIPKSKQNEKEIENIDKNNQKSNKKENDKKIFYNNNNSNTNYNSNHSKSKTENNRWFNITHIFNEKEKQKIFNVSISKETFAVLISSHIYQKNSFSRKTSNQSNDSQKIKKLKSNKIKPAEFIVQQLRWNQKFNKKEWIVGVELDKEISERSFEEINSDEGFYGYENTLIRYFKKNGIVIWDKHSKIDNF